MKKMKRLVSVLLAGMMVLAMLTACGGGGTSAAKSATDKAEEAYLTVFNTMYGMNLTNDETLRTQAKQVVDTCVTDDGALAEGKGIMMPVTTEPDKDGCVCMALIIPDSNGKPQGYSADKLAQFDDPDSLAKTVQDAMSGASGDMSFEQIKAMMQKAVKGMGVGAVQKKNDNIYIAVVMKIDTAAVQ